MKRKHLIGKTILVVDDETDLREIVCEELQTEGCQTLQASNGQLALEICKTHNIDGVVTDLKMPGGNGHDLLKHLNLNFPKLTALFLVSGDSGLGDIEAFAEGVNATLRKPIDYDYFLDTLAMFMMPERDRWTNTVLEPNPNFNIKLEFNTYTEAVMAKKLNFGHGGFFVQLTDEPIANELPKKGQHIYFELSFTNEKMSVIKGAGLVRWCRISNEVNLPRGCGIEFVNLSEDCIDDVLAIIHKIPTRTYIPRC